MAKTKAPTPEEIFKKHVDGWMLFMTDKGIKCTVEAMREYTEAYHKEKLREAFTKVKNIRRYRKNCVFYTKRFGVLHCTTRVSNKCIGVNCGIFR